MANDDFVTLRAQIFAGIEKRTDQYISHVFNLHKDGISDMLPVSELSSALREISICDSDECKVSPAELSSLGQNVTYETFKQLSEKCSALDQWAQSVPLWQLLSDSIPRKQGVRSRLPNFAALFFSTD